MEVLVTKAKVLFSGKPTPVLEYLSRTQMLGPEVQPLYLHYIDDSPPYVHYVQVDLRTYLVYGSHEYNEDPAPTDLPRIAPQSSSYRADDPEFLAWTASASGDASYSVTSAVTQDNVTWLTPHVSYGEGGSVTWTKGGPAILIGSLTNISYQRSVNTVPFKKVIRTDRLSLELESAIAGSDSFLKDSFNRTIRKYDEIKPTWKAYKSLWGPFDRWIVFKAKSFAADPFRVTPEQREWMFLHLPRRKNGSLYRSSVRRYLYGLRRLYILNIRQRYNSARADYYKALRADFASKLAKYHAKRKAFHSSELKRVRSGLTKARSEREIARERLNLLDFRRQTNSSPANPHDFEIHEYRMLNLSASGTVPIKLQRVQYSRSPDSDRLSTPGINQNQLREVRGGYSVISEILSDEEGFSRALHAFIHKHLAPHIESIDSKLVRKIYDKIGNQEVHIGNIIAERQGTIDLLSTTFRRLKSLAYAFTGTKKQIARKLALMTRSFRKNPGKEFASHASSELLAFKFGWEPLANDLYVLTEKLIGQNNSIASDRREKPFISVRANYGGKRSRRPFSFEDDGMSFVGNIEMSYTIYLSLDVPLLHELQSYGLTNPLEIAWELTPYSFVADWMIPFGAFFSAMQANAGMTFLKGCVKTRLTGTFVFKDNSTLSGAYTLPNDSGIVGEMSGTYIHREPIYSLPGKWKILGIKDPTSFWHFAEGTALITQAILSFKNKRERSRRNPLNRRT